MMHFTYILNKLPKIMKKQNKTKQKTKNSYPRTSL